MKRVVWYKEFIVRQDLRDNPDKIFLFGDNTIRQGFGGQAKEMRHEPNAIGIVTKRFPSNRFDSFLYDSDYDEIKIIIDRDFDSIPEGVTVVIPSDGLGTGLAKLDTQAPKIYNYILEKIKQL